MFVEINSVNKTNQGKRFSKFFLNPPTIIQSKFT